MTKTLCAQTEQAKFLHSLFTIDSSFTGRCLHSKIDYLDKNDFCKSIAYLFEMKMNKMYSEVLVLDPKLNKNTRKKVFDSLLIESGILEKTILKEAAKYDSLCHSSNVQKQIKLNNKRNRHSKKHLPKTIQIAHVINRNTKPYFSISNPIFFDNNSKAIILIREHGGKVYYTRYIELYEKNNFGKWISKEIVVLTFL